MGILDKVKKQKGVSADTVKEEKKQSKASSKKDAPKTQTNAASIASVTEAEKILIKPMLSEKTTMQEAARQYSFVVAADANKIQIRKAVQVIYGVHPIRVNVVHVEGKQKMFGRNKGRRNDWKKAIVTLKEGEKMDIHEGV